MVKEQRERDELRRRLARRPHAVRFAELDRLLRLAGWELARIEGSHYIYTREGNIFVVPFRRPHLLVVYVRVALRLTRELADGE